MTGDITDGLTVYNSGNVASQLGISNSTLRKYCLLLEEHNYKFRKNKHGQRDFLEKDVVTLRQLINIKKHSDMTLEQACKAVTVQLGSEDVSVPNKGVIASQERDNTAMFKSVISYEINLVLREQKQFNKLLLEKIEEQNIIIKQLSKRKDQELIKSLQQAQLEFSATEQEEKKPGFFSRLFSGK